MHIEMCRQVEAAFEKKVTRKGGGNIHGGHTKVSYREREKIKNYQTKLNGPR